MRVISGKCRGTKLVAPEGNNTRPTQDRVKESVFNIISNIIMDKNVLDVFAGSGNLGIEALSRGAEKCIFIDHDSKSIASINKNIQSTHLEDRALIYKEDVSDCIKFLANSNHKFDIIFMDPPYNTGMVNKTLLTIDDKKILNYNGIIIVERHKNDIIESDNLNTLEIYREKKYGDTFVSFLKNKMQMSNEEN